MEGVGITYASKIKVRISVAATIAKTAASTHSLAAVFIPFIYFPYLGFSKNERYAGEAVVKNYKKSAAA